MNDFQKELDGPKRNNYLSIEKGIEIVNKLALYGFFLVLFFFIPWGQYKGRWFFPWKIIKLAPDMMKYCFYYLIISGVLLGVLARTKILSSKYKALVGAIIGGIGVYLWVFVFFKYANVQMVILPKIFLLGYVFIMLGVGIGVYIPKDIIGKILIVIGLLIFILYLFVPVKLFANSNQEVSVIKHITVLFDNRKVYSIIELGIYFIMYGLMIFSPIICGIVAMIELSSPGNGTFIPNTKLESLFSFLTKHTGLVIMTPALLLLAVILKSGRGNIFYILKAIPYFLIVGSIVIFYVDMLFSSIIYYGLVESKKI
jgi:hypothetical protein